MMGVPLVTFPQSMVGNPQKQNTWVCMHGWMHGWMDGWMDGCMYACMYACMHVCIVYVCMYVCMYICTSIHHVHYVVFSCSAFWLWSPCPSFSPKASDPWAADGREDAWEFQPP